jgi:signal transduction histidine kinase
MRLGKSTKYCLYLILSLVFSSVNASATDNKYIVKEGILDLRGVDINSGFSVNMTGDWEFYPGKFLDPVIRSEDTLRPSFISVPSLWSSGTGLSKTLHGTGFGTYRCRVILPESYRNDLGFSIPAVETSYEMFINGRPVSANGKPGKNKNETSPAYYPCVIKYSPHTDTLDVLVKVANFEVCKGGFQLPIKIGSAHPIYESYTDARFFCSVSSNMLFTIFIFSIFIFLLNGRSNRALAFSLLIFSLALRPLFSSPYLITAFDGLSWAFIYRLKYFNLLMLLTSAAWFVHFRFPTRLTLFGHRISMVTFIVVSPAIFVLSPFVLSYSDIVINILAVLLIGHALVISFTKATSRKLIDIIQFFSIAIIAFGVYSDINLSYGKTGSYSIFITSFTILFYALMQSVLMIKEWVSNTKEREALYIRSEELTKDLENRVEERTSELSRKNIEIEEQNRFITEQNKKLKDTISVKNRIFAVISHDLRSPIVNILYGLNLIKDDKSGEDMEFLTNTCIKNSRQVISLLENMLTWGQEQEDQIHYSPAYHDIADVILTNMSIYKESTDKKNIRLNFTQVGTSKGWFDKDLVDIIIRNLISNSIKFTSHNGRINITVKGNERTGEGLVMKIADNGIGMPTDQLEDLCLGKSIGSTPGTDNEKGTGIGLRLVFDLVKISQGTIKAESTPSAGTTFTIVLPGQTGNNQLLNSLACN